MEVILDRDAFLKGLQMVQNIVEPRQTLPMCIQMYSWRAAARLFESGSSGTRSKASPASSPARAGSSSASSALSWQSFSQNVQR